MSHFMKLSMIAVILAFFSVVINLAPGIAVASTPELTVGVIMSEKLPQFEKAHEAFIKTLKDEGYGPESVQVYLQVPNPDPMSWANSVRKFVAVGVDVIVTYGSPATHIALREAGNIPVVFSYVYSPDSEISSHKNSTGVSSHVPIKALLATLRQLKPYQKLAVIYSPDNEDSMAQFIEVRDISGQMRFSVVEVGVKSLSDVIRNLKDISGKADAMFICSSVAIDESNEVIRIAGASGMPTAAMLSDMADSGAALTLDASAEEQGLMAAKKVADILRGRSASDSPMSNARQIDLVLNLQALNAIGMKVPFDIINSATRVVK